MFFPTAGPRIHSDSILELSLHQGLLDHLQPAAMDVSPKGWREGPREEMGRYGKMMEYYSIPSGKHTYISIENGYS